VISVIDLLVYNELDEFFLTPRYRSFWPCVELSDFLQSRIHSDSIFVILNKGSSNPFGTCFEELRIASTQDCDPLENIFTLILPLLNNDLLVIRPSAGVVTLGRIESFLARTDKANGSVSCSDMHHNMHPDWTCLIHSELKPSLYDGFQTIFITPHESNSESHQACGSQFLRPVVFLDKALAFLPKHQKYLSDLKPIYCPVKNKPLIYQALYF